VTFNVLDPTHPDGQISGQIDAQQHSSYYILPGTELTIEWAPSPDQENFLAFIANPCAT
jgi:hypothetical protein